MRLKDIFTLIFFVILLVTIPFSSASFLDLDGSYDTNNPYKYVDPTGEIPVDIIVDVAFIAYGAYRFAKDPSFRTAGDFGADVDFAFLPYVPNVKRLAEGAKLAEKGVEAARAGEKVRDVEKTIETAKNVPNPYGRLGSPEHRAEVEKITREIESNQQLKAQKEYTIRDPQTNQVKRFADVASVSKDKPVEFFQVGRVTKTGEPVARERRAIQDIQKTTGKRVTFRQYTPRRR